MTNNAPVAERLPSSVDAPATEWDVVRQRLEDAGPVWLATVRPDGRPHVMPLLAIWVDATVYFSASGTSRKAKNLARNASCVLSVSNLAPTALDLVLEGTAAIVRDAATLQRVADAFASVMHWPVTVRDGAFHGDSAPTAGPPPFDLYAFTPAVGFGLPSAAAPAESEQKPAALFGPTRWRF